MNNVLLPRWQQRLLRYCQRAHSHSTDKNHSMDLKVWQQIQKSLPEYTRQGDTAVLVQKIKGRVRLSDRTEKQCSER